MIDIERIVGTSNEENWTQVYTFFPEGEKKARGALFLALGLLKKEEEESEKKEYDLAAFGKEAITRFHETFYSPSAKENILKNLKKSFKILSEEFGENFEVEGLAGVVLPRKDEEVLYLAKKGGGQVRIWREDKLFSLFSSFAPATQMASGFLKGGDVVILGTKDFFEAVSEGTLRASLQQDKLSETVEMIAPLVHGREDNSGMGVVFFKAASHQPPTPEGGQAATSHQQEMRREEKEEDVEDEKDKTRIERKGLKRLISSLRERLKRFSFRKRRGLGVSVKRERKARPVKKTALSVAVVFLILLGLSVFLGSKRKKETHQFVTESALLEKVAYNLEEAQGLVELNPLRAKSLLNEAEDLLEEYRLENEQTSEEFEGYKLKVADLLAEVSKEYQIESADIFFDFSLVKEGFSGESVGLAGSELAVLSEDKEAVVGLSLKDKSAEILAGGEDAEGVKEIGAVAPWVFLAGDKSLKVVDKVKKERIDEEKLENMEIVSLVGFGGNAYILDKEGGQIWRFSGLEDGLASPKAYLKGEEFDFSEAASMAIDGSVWVLFSNGEIVKYTRGLKDAFSIAGLDTPFSDEIKLFTNEDVENLYVLDKLNTRVVVIGKSGEYRGAYIWSGIAGARDMVVSEELGKILLLTGDRVYGIDLTP